jgi:hypothetical protein
MPGSLFSGPGNRQSSSLKKRRPIAASGLVLVLVGGLVALAASSENLDEAIRQQQARVAQRPADAGSLNDLGNLLVLAGDLAAAEDAYRRAIAVAPDLVSSHYNLALLLLQADRQKEALKNLHTALELDPQHAWSHYQMGTIMADRRNRNQALRHYTEAFRLDRSLTSPKVNPHIVENRLATEALLTIHAEEPAATHAPRSYEDPGHIADLLLPAEPSLEAAPEAADEPPAVPGPDEQESPRKVTSQERSMSPRSSTPASPAEPYGSTDAATEPPVAATPSGSQDIDEGGSTATEPRRIDSSSIRSFRSGTGETESPSSAEPGADPGSTGASAPAPDAAPPAGEPLDSSRSYLPGVQSTGRLEIELLPASESAPTVRSS